MTAISAPTYGLALHTTTPELAFAVSNFAGDARSHVWDLGRGVSNLLHEYLAEFIHPQTWQDLAFIAVAKGPGGFTGTRIGVVTARTLAQQLDIPLFAVSTLAAVVWLEKIRLDSLGIAVPDCFAVQMPAQRGQVFTGIYQFHSASNPHNSSADPQDQNPQLEHFLACVQGDRASTPEQWQQLLDQLQTPYHLVTAPENLGKSVNGILDLAYHDWQFGKRPDWHEALPFYGQHPVESS
jgi:tRNA threonylcarbamoyl adenosine modification protein YeaZ